MRTTPSSAGAAPSTDAASQRTTLGSIVLIQRFLPHYRMRFLNKVCEELAKDNLEFRVLFSYRLGSVHVPAWAQAVPAMRLRVGMTGIQETVAFAPTLAAKLWGARPALVILEDLGGWPNSLACAVVCRWTRTPYLVWGLGRIPKKRPSVWRRILRPVIRWYYKRAAGFICYSRHACDVYGAYGKPTYLASNAVLEAPSRDQRRALDVAIASRGGGTHLEIAYLGSLTPQKGLDRLLAALTAIPELKPRLHVIGDGPDKARLQEFARHAGVVDSVIFHGAIYDDTMKWKILRNCELGVLPGRGGLAIQELMFYGIPVISGVADGTERDLIDPGMTGFLIDGVPRSDDLVREARRYAGLSRLERSRMGRAAAEAIMTHFNVDTMARAFIGALRSTLAESVTRGHGGGRVASDRPTAGIARTDGSNEL